ncbi:endonuclease/exonuclease/phosphatase family protein [Roseivivax sp. CAU 1761]
MTAMRRWATRLVLVLLFVAALASFLPLFDSDAWWVRYWDFPRLQLALALSGLAVLYLLLRPRIRRAGGAVLALAGAALAYHAVQLWPYLGPVAPVAAEARECRPGAGFSVMAANVQKTNDRSAAFLETVRDADPDVLVVMETDADWDRDLSALDARYPHARQHIPEERAFYGMHVYSRLPLQDAGFEFHFGAATPAFRGNVLLERGGRVRLYGLHPQPPHVSGQPSTLRDAHLLAAALEMADDGVPSVVAGDLNATPWERSFRRSARLGGLLDPRVGRGLLPTFAADDPVMSWPLDHIVWQERLTLSDLRVLPGFGSDHYPVMATLCLDPEGGARNRRPEPRPDDRRAAEEAIAAARRLGGGDGG